MSVLPPWQTPSEIEVIAYTLDPTMCPLCGGNGTYAGERGAEPCDWPPCEASRTVVER